MEKQIKQLVELSKRYYGFALSMELKDCAHNVLRGNFKGYNHLNTYDFSEQSNDEQEIRVYFADKRETKAINFGEIEISDYKGKISMPVTITESELQEIYEDALLFLENHLLKYTA